MLLAFPPVGRRACTAAGGFCCAITGSCAIVTTIWHARTGVLQDRFVRNATQLYRSDFFPGLGWMLNTRVWHSVRDNW